MRKGIIAFILLLLVFLTIGCGSKQDGISRQSKERSISLKEHQHPGDEITLSAIGDILVHDRVYEVAKTDQGYNFKPMLSRVKQYLDDTTITFANQETMIGGEEIGLSSYPAFNSPHEVGDALKDAGVNIVSLANNHTLDRGEEAIQNAIKHWETINMMYIGSFKDEEDRNRIRILHTEEGISVAFLAYTYGTNGISVPNGKNYLVNFIEKEMIASDISRAQKKADVIVLSLHFGNEYERMPSNAQKDLVQFAADLGVHIVLGHHPHVLQPIDWVEGEKGNKTLVAYSLGNFLSGQDGLYRQIGGVFQCTIRKVSEKDGDKIVIASPKFLPTYVTYGDWQIIPMFELTELELPNAKKYYEEIKRHMSQYVPDLEFIEE